MSVIVTVYNGEAFARVAVETILAQTLGDLEAIVVDDGSTDGTVESLRQLDDRRVRLFPNPGRAGRARCLNQGVGLARADLVAIMDADDLSFPDRLARQVSELRIRPHLDMAGSQLLRTDTNGLVLGVGPDPAGHVLGAAAWRSVPIPHPTWCGRRRWFEDHPYRNWLPCAEDHDLLYRALPTSRLACLDDVLLVKRERELTVPTLLRRRAWFTASALPSDLAAGRWRRAGSFALGTAVAAGRLLVNGDYDPSWRWSPPTAEVLDRYDKLRRTYLGTPAA